MLDRKLKMILVVAVISILSVGTIYAVGPTNIIFKTSDGTTSQEVMRITSDGKVGIGTTTPKSNLDVNGGIAVGGTPQRGVWHSRIPVTNTAATVDSAGNVGSDTSITIGTDGLPVVSFYDQTNGDLKLVHCTSTSCGTHDTPVTLDSAGTVGLYTSIIIGMDGFPLISYYDQTNGDLKTLHCGNVSCSQGNTATTLVTSYDSGVFNSIARPQGFPLVSYYDLTNGDLKLAGCYDESCGQNVDRGIFVLDSIGDVGLYSSFTTSPDVVYGVEDLVFSYYDQTNGDLKVLYCDYFCRLVGNPIVVTVVDSIGNVGYYTSITIGTDGLPVVSYYDQTNGDLKILHCGNVTCTSGNTATTVDSTGDVGQYTSITIGTDGLPVVSYYDHTNDDLKILHCVNAACTSGNTATTADSAGNVGGYTSITIGTDGLPVISYYDTTNGDLKVLHCGSTICKSFWTRR